MEAQEMLARVQGDAPGALGFLMETLGQDGTLEAPFSAQILLVEGAYVAGCARVPGIEGRVARLAVGTRLTLQREPGNAHDRWAIKVLTPDGGKLGYLPCDCNEVLARLMDAGKCLYAILTSRERFGTHDRLCIDVFMED